MGIRVLLFGCILIAAAHSSFEDHDNHEETKRILLTDNYYSIISQLETLTKKVESLEAKLANHSHSAIAFAAKLTKEVSGSGHHIYFDDVVLNMGNAYNPHHGMFVAPINGTYEFSLKACSTNNHFIVLDIMVNNLVRERMIAGDVDLFACSSTSLPVHLIAGDDVYVKQGPGGDSLSLVTSWGTPHFNGILIQTD